MFIFFFIYLYIIYPLKSGSCHWLALYESSRTTYLLFYWRTNDTNILDGMRVSKWMAYLNFWVNYLFNLCFIFLKYIIFNIIDFFFKYHKLLIHKYQWIFGMLHHVRFSERTFPHYKGQIIWYSNRIKILLHYSNNSVKFHRWKKSVVWSTADSLSNRAAFWRLTQWIRLTNFVKFALVKSQIT